VKAVFAIVYLLLINKALRSKFINIPCALEEPSCEYTIKAQRFAVNGYGKKIG